MISAELKGVSTFDGNAKKFVRELRNELTRGLRRGLAPTLSNIKRDVSTQSGLGRRIWGQNPGGLNALVGFSQTFVQTTYVQAGVRLKGLVAMIEAGGRTKAHTIKPKLAKLLSFEVGGRRILTGAVRHPGAPIRAHHLAERRLQADAPKLVSEANVAMGTALRGAFGG